MCHQWTYLQRTAPGISHHVAPLEDGIRHKLIPALVGRGVSDTVRLGDKDFVTQENVQKLSIINDLIMVNIN